MRHADLASIRRHPVNSALDHAITLDLNAMTKSNPDHHKPWPRQISVKERSPDGSNESDYADAFEIERSLTDQCDPEEYARAGFAGLPEASRRSGMKAHRHVLRFRLGPFADANHIFGWRVVGRSNDTITLEAKGPLMDGYMVWRVSPGRATLTTFLKFRRPMIAAFIWRYAGRIHRRGAPRLLQLATRAEEHSQRCPADIGPTEI